MTALSADRRTTELKTGVRRFDVAAATIIYKGSLVVLDASGDAEPGSTATGKTAVGRAEETVDNSGGAAGDKTVDVKAGIFLWENDGGDAIDGTHVEGTAYITDDQTVSATDGTGTKSEAGRIVQVDPDGNGVFVATGTP